MPVRTKIEISPAIARRIASLDDLARIFFPDNRNHQRAFIAVWLEIKYAQNQFLASSTNITSRYDLSPRTLEVVRAKLKKLGLIKRISHFNPSHGYHSGWTFSPRFRSCISSLSHAISRTTDMADNQVEERKDKDSINYV